MENIDELKHDLSGQPRYKLSNGNIYVSKGGFHYIDYLDAVSEISPEIGDFDLDDAQVDYIEGQLQSNESRFDGQVAAVKRTTEITGKSVLDIGCGGGLFLKKMREQGADVMGVELSDDRAKYASEKNKLTIVKRPVEDPYWEKKADNFDIVTLWDVIEHVNYPAATLMNATKLIKPGGYLLIDTPCRDSFYHVVGEWTYKLSRGRFPTFLNTMYSAHQFGHKQIFSTQEMRALYTQEGFEVLELKKFHELSFPYKFYLKKLLKSDILVTLSLPLVTLGLKILPVRNKMLIIGRKK